MKIATKIAAKDSCNYALNKGNSNETNIKITSEIASLFGKIPDNGESFDVTFIIEKCDFLICHCQIMSALPLYNSKGSLIHFSEALFNEKLQAINDFFNENKSVEIKARLTKPGSHPLCLNFGPNNFCIRDYLVENRSVLTFTQNNSQIKLNIKYDKKASETLGTALKEASAPLQRIFYGAPGTGKSHEIKTLTKGEHTIRTTFHPDSDYSTFVGAYKPTTIEVPLRDVTGKIIIENGVKVTESRIIYEFVEQAFLRAYINAWKLMAASTTEETKKQYLIIEEINRGNCAQIFGDIFQLLDRNEFGFSDYYIKADKDIKKLLSKSFKDLDIPDKNRINSMYDEDVISQILKGDILILPDNLYIWASMNTSDQSLFPIDSAFKRRWDWKYIPVSEGKNKDKSTPLGWVIKANNHTYDWWSFIKKINYEIDDLTKSEDKQLGYFFCKTSTGIISAETFVNKVLFYLWKDVFKDFEKDKDFLFNENNEELDFCDFFSTDNEGKSVIREDRVALFLDRLHIDEVLAADNEESDIDKKHLKVVFPDGETFEYKNSTQTYVEVINKIGPENIVPLNLKISGYDILSKERITDNLGYRNSQKMVNEDLYLMTKYSTEVKSDTLKTISDQLHIDLNIKIIE